MPVVWIPPALRPLAAGQEQVAVSGATVRQAIDELERLYPGIGDRLLDGEQLRAGISVAVDGVITRQRLRQPLVETSEVHFLPALSGG